MTDTKKKLNEIEQELNNAKIALLLPVARFYELPDFDIENPTMNGDLINSFFEVVIKLVSDLGVGDENSFKYHKKNFPSCIAENQAQFLSYLKMEKIDPHRNDSIYRLGFRTISVILRNNLDKIDVLYLSKIYGLLQPFFNCYSHKELLICGLAPNWK